MSGCKQSGLQQTISLAVMRLSAMSCGKTMLNLAVPTEGQGSPQSCIPSKPIISVASTNVSHSLSEAVVALASLRSGTARAAARLKPNGSQCTCGATSARVWSSFCRLGYCRASYKPLFGASIGALVLDDVDQQLTTHVWSASDHDGPARLIFGLVSISHCSLIGAER
jgi:hypothetical protein